MLTPGRLQRRDARQTRWWVAIVSAGWCVLWTAGLASASLGLPGILSGDGTAGIFELPKLLFGMEIAETVIFSALACLLFFWLVMAGLQWLDRDGAVAAVVHWQFGFSPWSLTLAIWALAGCLGGAVSEGAAAVFMFLSFLLFVASPFFLLNPATLRKSRLRKWWRPFWPGWFAVGAGIAYLIACLVTNMALAWVRLFGSPWLSLLSQVVDLMLSVLMLLACIALWIHRTPMEAWCSLHQPGHGSHLRSLAAVGIALGVLPLILVAVPTLAATVFQVFFLPQYVAHADNASALPAPMQAASALSRVLMADSTVPVLATVLEAIFLLGIGRCWLQPFDFEGEAPGSVVVEQRD